MRTLWLSSVVVFASAVSAVAQDDPSAVIKKAIEAHGGTEVLSKTTLARSVSKGTMTLPSGAKMNYVATAVYSLPDKYRLELQGELSNLKMVTTQVLNGKKVKSRATLGGVDQPLPEKVKDETIQAALVQEITILTPLMDKARFTLRADKDADVNGTPAAVVVVSSTGVRDVKLFFDKKTGTLVKTQRKGLAPTTSGTTEVDEETLLSDFKKHESGVLLPMSAKVLHNGKEYLTLTVSELKLLDKIDPADFAIDE